MYWNIIVFLNLCGICFCTLLDPDSRTLSSRVVNTRYGSIRGFISSLSNRQLSPAEVFLGVPYAGAPKGPLRFMPPVTSPHWKGVQLADHFSPVCPQKLPDVSNETEALKVMPLGRFRYLRRLLPYLTNQSEDCLYLNIYAPGPVNQDGQKLPVMVYIHGESYEWNAGNPYDGRVLASFGNVVVVTINYRLGILGFLPAVDRSARGNYGLMDQVAALHWIQENIEEFGGDTGNVTIFGHGYGAACVNFLMLSPMAKGLFHRAIMHSGSALSPWAVARDAIAHTLHVARVLNCPAQHNTALVECLRKRDLQDIMNVDIKAPDYISAFGPTVDGIVLPQDPAEAMETNAALFTQYDLMFGATRVESYFQFSASEEKFGIDNERRDRVLRTMVRNLFTYHLQEIFLTIVNEYMDWSRPFLHATDIFDGTIDAMGDALVVAPIIRVGTFHSGSPRDTYSYSSSSTREKKSFFYIFGYQTEFGDYSSRLGCVTGEELSYVFGAPMVTALSHFSTNYSKAESALSEIIMLQWTNFAKFGDPNVSSPNDTLSENIRGRYEKVTWPAYEPVHQKYLSISMKPRVRDHYHAHRLSYWLNLIPRLHSSGDVNVSVQHHRLQDHDNPLSYDGTVRHLPNGLLSLLSTQSPIPNHEKEHHSLVTNDTNGDVNASSKIGLKNTEIVSKLDKGNNTYQNEKHQQLYTTALIVTIAVGCTLLVLNVAIFAAIYYQREKDSLEKKLQKSFYQERRSDDEEGHPSSEKPFLVKDLSSSMMLNQYCSQQEFDGSQTLDLVQPSKVKQFQSQSVNNRQQSNEGSFHITNRTPQAEKGVGVREAQPLLTPPSSTPHTVVATADCLQGWPHAQEMSVTFGKVEDVLKMTENLLQHPASSLFSSLFGIDGHT